MPHGFKKISKTPPHSHLNCNNTIFPLELPIYFNYEWEEKYIKPCK